MLFTAHHICVLSMFVRVSWSMGVFVCNFNKSSGFTVNIYFAEQTIHYVASQPAI